VIVFQAICIPDLRFEGTDVLCAEVLFRS